MKQVGRWYSSHRDENVERPRVVEGMICSRSKSMAEKQNVK